MEIKRNSEFTRNVKCSDVYTESVADYSLPDYLGDVRKILFTDAALRPSGRFAGGDEVEFSGVVVYNVVYLDADNNLSSVEFTSDYDYSVKCSAENYKDSISNTRVSNYAVRLMGPRKMSARASLVGSVSLSECESLSVSGSAFEADNSPEVNTKTVKIRSTKLSELCERECAEQIARLDGAIADEVSVVYCGAEPCVDSVTADDGTVCVKGKLRMYTVLKNADAPAYEVDKTVNFEENLSFEGVNSDMYLTPELSVTSLKANINADDAGCEVVLSCIVEFCIVGDTNENVDLTTDAYLKSSPTENSYEDFTYYKLVDCCSVRGSHNAELDRAQIESNALHDIVFLTATPKVEHVQTEEGCVNILGEIRYSGVASEMLDDKISYVSVKFSSPFAVNVNTSCQNLENLQVDAKVMASCASATIDANNLYATCQLDSCVTVCEEKRERVLASCSKSDGESYESVGASITVYYPTSEDTLFSVAKRFRTSSLKVARDNDISESVFAADNPDGKLAGVRKLIIY